MVAPVERPSRTIRNRFPKSISIVVPCYNEEDVLHELERRLIAVAGPIGCPFELVMVDDGSRDRTWEILKGLQEKDSRWKIVRMSRNYGHQLALTCGLDQASGEVVVIMDADLQDPPELLNDMIGLWKQGYDVVYGKRSSRRGEPFSKKLFAFLFYRTMSRVTGLAIPEDTGDFRLMDRSAVNALQSMRERHRFIRGMVSWVGFHQAPIHYERPERFAGTTKYPFRKSFRFAIDGITSFSTVPLKLATVLGLVLSGLSFLYIFVVIALKFLDISVPGYTSLMATILLLGGVQLIVLGIVGEYVGRIFEQGQNRPLYLIDEIAGEPLK